MAFALGFLILPKYWTGERRFAFESHDIKAYALWFGGPPLIRALMAAGLLSPGAAVR